MAFKDSNGQDNILSQVLEHIHKKFTAKEAKLICEFARQFYGNVSRHDLESKSVLDLYGAILSQWSIIKKRQPGESKVHIYNPHFEQHGWQSTHTIVEINHDDMPFLVDSLRMEIVRMGFTTHHIIHYGGLKVKRNKVGEAVDILPFNTSETKGVVSEAPIYMEIDRQTQQEVLQKIEENLQIILQDVRAAVEDWSKMRGKMRETLAMLDNENKHLKEDEVSEAKAFLKWMENDNFTFLGYRYYSVVSDNGEKALNLDEASGLGVLRDSSKSRVFRSFSELPPEAKKQALSKNVLIISKTNTRSTVHRPVYTDYIGVKVFDDAGELVGEHRFIGLYTSSAYNSNPKNIPFVRHKVALILKESNLSATGHAGKALLNVLETLPRDDLFQAPTHELYELALGIVHLQERKKIRLFVRKDIYGRFISCLVYVPRESFTTQLAQRMEAELLKSFKGLEISYTTRFSDSVLARIHFVIRVDPKEPIEYSITQLENKLAEIGRGWSDELREYLLDYYGEERANHLFSKYARAFPAGYLETFTPRTAIYDIEHIEALCDELPLSMAFYRPLDEAVGSVRFKLFRPNESIPLSDALPIFENMGLRVIGERPYKISLSNGETAWINDFSVIACPGVAFEIEAIKDIFQEAFFHVWMAHAEDDSFNELVLTSRLDWREISILRAYTKYLRQTGFTYSQNYIEDTVTKYPVLARMLVHMFLLRFEPNMPVDEDAVGSLEVKIKKELDSIAVLDEDKIMRRFLDLISATLRTNYFQKDAQKQHKEYLSFKLDPNKIPELPLPLPMYEIFVYSPKLEGVHLRSSKVARGGLRWSDRREDFRTEILGLMKAQNVKNAVIVPSGAKGGFVCKELPVNGTREEIMEEVVHCYRIFIKGLLDITDNFVDGEAISPLNVKCYDESDPYLVVAADKGTATFSDIANSISREYNFWLDDAFASGGSTGYDHKKMGITARGAWESVKRHFRELGHDIQSSDFTVVGIGDMSGDVFGNGMLLSKHIKLVAAFNHMHIFIDPSPDPKVSYEERKRLFELPRSSWEDYNADLISKGGGIYRRTAKAIKLTPEVKELLNIKKDFIVPNELIRCILTARIDLLWNGGIGTYVKAKSEEHVSAGDRTNDALRVNGSQLRCRVVGEGGNLGLTQLGRIEYALKGGLIYTDFIDNSAGVDCSDHEVNIKILLNTVVSNGDMTEKQRNKLLAEMTDEVGELVLKNNYQQTQAISLTAERANKTVDLHNRIIEEMAHKNQINTELEFLPNSQVLMERKAKGKGLTRPELAILFAYNKSLLKADILNSEVPEDPHLTETLVRAFPQPLQEKYSEQMQSHRLSREITATILSNALINEMGFTFVTLLQSETGAPVSAIVRAYSIIRRTFNWAKLRRDIEKLDYKIPNALQAEMLYNVSRLIRRSTRWMLRNRRMHLDIKDTTEHFQPSVQILFKSIDKLIVGKEKERYQEVRKKYMEAGVPAILAGQIASVRPMISALDIIESANLEGFSLEEVAETYFHVGEHLELCWFRDAINSQNIDNRWEALAKEACRDDLDWQQRGLTIAILSANANEKSLEKKMSNWLLVHNHLIERWKNMLSNLRSTSSTNFVMFTVAVRELMDLTQASRFQPKKKKNQSQLQSAPVMEEKTKKNLSKTGTDN